MTLSSLRKAARFVLATLLLGIALLVGARSTHAQSGYAWVRSLGRPAQYGNLTGVAVDSSGNIYVTNYNNGSIDVFDPLGNFLFDFGIHSSNGAYGTLNGPYKIVRDSAGNFYVADTYFNRIQKFDAKGHFLLQIGSAGSRNGQLSYPYGVAVDGAGNIYVADSNNNRIQKFNAKGLWLLKFGTGGSGNGQFNNPQAVTLDSSGNIYVADTNNKRIQKFSPTGKFLLTFGQFGNLQDVAVDSAGNVYAADYSNANIQKFTASGKFVASVGVGGVQAINFDSVGNLYAVTNNGWIAVINPTTMLWKSYIVGMSANYLATDSSGNTYVSDNNGRLLKFDPTGKVLQNFVIPYQAQGVAVDSTGNIYVADYQNSQILKYATSGGTPITIATGGSGNGQVSNPYGLALDSSGNLYVADTNNHRIEKFSPTGTFVASFGSNGNGNGQFSYPHGVYVDSTGNIYVADSSNDRVQKLNKTGKFLLAFGGPGAGNGQFQYPTDLTVDGSGNIYVTDWYNPTDRVQKFNSSGVFTSVLVSGLNNPTGIRLDSAGNLLIADTNNGRILKFNTKGQILSGYDSSGANYYGVTNPLGVRIDSNNNLYVTGNWGQKITPSGNVLGGFNGGAGLALDANANVYVVGGNSVAKFNSSLTYVGGFGSQGTGNSQFNKPSGITLDSKGNIYVTDPGNYRVQKFTSTFAYAGQFGSQGTGDGQFNNPTGIAVNSLGEIIVADNGYDANFIDVFSPGSFFPFLGSFGGPGNEPGLFSSPYDINQDSAGNLYIADPGNVRLQIFDPNFNFLFAVGGNYGGGSGQLMSVSSGAIDSVGNIYVADNYTNRISVFAPIPLLSTVTPLTAPAGSAALTLTATGSGFTPDAAITFNGTPLTTTFVSSTSLTATLPTTLLATAGNFPVAVLQAGGTSNAFSFAVTGVTLPTVTSVNPTSTTAGVASVALTVTGTNFVNGAVIYFGTAGLPTTLVSSTQLTATVPASLLTTPGTVSVTVAQSGAVSNAVNFTINSAGAPPTISALSPASVDLGSPTQTLTLTGTGFTSDAVVSFNGIALTTTFGSATQLTATLPANLLTTAGAFPVTVSQASGVSSAVGFSVNAPAPTITNFSPPNARVGSAAITLSVSGTNFTSDAVVSFNGIALTTTFVSATQVVATIPATLLTTAGFYPVVVSEASGSADPVGFAVNVAPPTVTGLSPTAVLRGSAAINLIVTGVGFTSDAVITFNGTALTTTFGSSTQLTATIPASLLTSPGFYPVIIKQVSGVSRKVLFIVL